MKPFDALQTVYVLSNELLGIGAQLNHSSVLNLFSMFFSDTPLHDVIFLSLLQVSLVVMLEVVRFPLRCLDEMVFELIAVRK